jgi:hypothetical protein
MASSKRVGDRMMTSEKLLQMLASIMQLVERSKGQCECTVHRRTGNIIEVCEACSADVSLNEIYDHVAQELPR